MEMTYTETLTVTHCWCGIAVAIPENLYRFMKQSSKHGCYCPIGHEFYFNDTYEKKLAEEQAAHERARQREKAVRDLLAAEERSHRATRGVVTRMKKRESAGVCPCCQRSFQNVARHMATKHPDYAAS